MNLLGIHDPERYTRRLIVPIVSRPIFATILVLPYRRCCAVAFSKLIDQYLNNLANGTRLEPYMYKPVAIQPKAFMAELKTPAELMNRHLFLGLLRELNTRFDMLRRTLLIIAMIRRQRSKALTVE
jgi:hypothetical protein